MSTTNYIDQINPTPYAIWFADIPPTTEASVKPLVPFTVHISAHDTGSHVIDLYSQYSNSQPYQNPQNKWSHLVPQWRFTDIDDNIIDQIVTTDTVIYSGSQVLGVTGYAQFYITDDIGSPLGFPLIIWATMQVSGLPLYAESYQGTIDLPSYSNSMVVTYVPYYINGLAPYELHITRNGIDPMSTSVYWQGFNIPNIISLHGNTGLLTACSDDDRGLDMLYDYPSSNELGIEMGPIDWKIVTIPTSSQHWTSLDTDASASYFQATDDNGFRIGGYTRNNVVSDLVTLNTYITAGVDVKYYTPYRDTPFLWVSHPNNHTLYRYYYPYVDPTVLSGIASWLYLQSQINNIIYDVPYLTEKVEAMSLTGFGGIYGIAVDQCYNVWTTDGEMDKIYKFNYAGTLLSTINLNDFSALSSLGVSGGCTPAGVAMDSTSGLWVTLFDSTSVLKFNRQTGDLLTIINPGGPYGDSSTDPTYKPTLAEPDQEDNVWVSYTNPVSSVLKKYSSDGATTLTTITLPTCSNPMDLLIDYNNDLWVSLTYHAGPPYLQGQVQKYSSVSGVATTTISVSHPEYLTMDKNGNIWFTHGFNTVKKYNTTTSQLSSFVIGDPTTPSWYNPAVDQEYNCLEGITCDSFNRIWVINSHESKLYLLSGDQIITTMQLASAYTDWYVAPDLSIIPLTSDWLKSIQAFGDWSGIRWTQKYLTTSTLLSTFIAHITGSSDTFNIDSFSGYEVRKFNESWDATTQIRNYALPEHLYDDYDLFVNYIGTMIGGLETSANSLGRLIYERTANFVGNHGDADTSNISQLYSLADKINVPIDQYPIQFPADLKRLMDIVSIPHNVLWGERCKCALNFKDTYNYCDNCGHKHNSNRGGAIYTTAYVVSTEIPFLAEYKFKRNVYELITPMVSSLNIFSVASGYLLNDPEDYCYYEYIPTTCNVQNEGIINWDDDYTTLSETTSSLDEWYGKGQLVEKMISFLLHRGLGF